MWLLTTAAIVVVIASFSIGAINIRKSADTSSSMPSIEGKLYLEPDHGDGRKVLYINSYEPSFTSSAAELNGIVQTLNESGVDCDAVYMETHIETAIEEQRAFFKKIQNRVKKVHYDGVIASDDAALQFVMDNRESLFKDLPVTFMGVNDVNRAEAACELNKVTGVMENADLKSTIEAARKIMPRADHVVGILDDTPSGIGDQQAFKAIYEDFPDLTFEILDVTSMPWKKVGEKMESYDDSDIIIHISCFRDSEGVELTIPESAALVTDHAGVPVFRCNAGGVGNGIIGGRFMDFRHSGVKAAQILLTALDGKDLSGIPLDKEMDGVFVFDYSVMKKFGIDIKQVPDDSQFVNYDPSYWQANRNVLIPVMTAFLGLALLVLIAGYHYLKSSRLARRLGSSETALRNSNERLTYLYTHDSLTGLGNKYAFSNGRADYLRQPVIILFFDVLNFKYINDMFGHQMGDEILRQFGKKLTELFGEKDSFRYGGNEFLVLFHEGNVEECRQRCLRLKEEMSHLNVFGRNMWADFACGYVAGLPENEDQLYDMIHLADIRIYDAKEHRNFKFAGGAYDPDMNKPYEVEKKTLEQLESKHRDSVTGLSTHNYFISKVTELLNNEIVRFEQKPVIVYLNVLNFKYFNEQYGFDEGDKLLRYIASSIQELFPVRSVTRVSGDHFLMMVYEDECGDKLDRLLDRVREYKSGSRLDMKCGICPIFKNENVGLTCDHAMLACDSIRDAAEHKKLYDASFRKEEEKEQYILGNIDKAIREGWIVPYYQPIINAADGKPAAMEALARWKDPEKGILSPADFIPVLEENNEIYKVDVCIIRAAVDSIRKAQESGGHALPVSVNLSRRDFSGRDMVKEVTRIVDGAGVSHDMVCIEITESAIFGDMEFGKRILEGFHNNGFEVWMDDFGSGYSSLNLLQEMNFDLIKIDMRFMKDFREGSRNSVIVESIVSMARRLGIRTLSEGVETREQADLLRKTGCQRLQGYYFGKPQP